MDVEMLFEFWAPTSVHPLLFSKKWFLLSLNVSLQLYCIPFRTPCKLFTHAHDFIGPLIKCFKVEWNVVSPFWQWEILDFKGHGPSTSSEKCPFVPMLTLEFFLHNLSTGFGTRNSSEGLKPVWVMWFYVLSREQQFFFYQVPCYFVFVCYEFAPLCHQLNIVRIHINV